MSSSSLFSSDSTIKEAKRAPPKPIGQPLHVPIMPIASNQFPPFSYFYICATRATNLHNCSLQSLYLVIRTHPTLQPIITPNAWCNDSEAVFNCGYSLDFTNVPHFSLGDFTPVVEVYIRYPKKSQLVGVAFLPLKVIQTHKINNKPLTYLYQNNPVDLKDVASLHVVGSIFVTVALGEREHQSILDPNSPQFNMLQPPKPQPKKKKVPPKKARRYSSDYYSDYSYSEDEYDDEDWTVLALKHGWIKPGSSGNWKEKALKKGWREPSKCAYYSTLVDCDLDERALMCENGAQTTKSIINDEINEIVEDCQNAEEQFQSAKNDIKSLCSTGTKPSMHIEQPTQIYSSSVRKSKKKFSISNVVVYSSSEITQKIEKISKIDKIESGDIDISSTHESIMDKIKIEEEEEDIELDESLMKQISVLHEKKSQNASQNLHILSESDESDDFKPINEEESDNSELILTGSNKFANSNSSQKSKSSGKSQKSNPVQNEIQNEEEEIHEAPQKSKSSSSSLKKDDSFSGSSIIGSARLLIPKANKSNESEEESFKSATFSDISQHGGFIDDPLLGIASNIDDDDDDDNNSKGNNNQKSDSDKKKSPLDLSVLEKLNNKYSDKSNENKEEEKKVIPGITEPIMISNITDDLDFKFNMSDSPPPKLRYSSTTGTLTSTENKPQNTLTSNNNVPLDFKSNKSSSSHNSISKVDNCAIEPLDQDDLDQFKGSSVLSDDDDDDSDSIF
ncbi:hypothetical protein TRFO_14129 [Tritrichomonas foetus]|uniref:C2 domain-containing protein n=1 Tax=Tritrichomonas foetus TaxID=1144522 RepID=A0A1J4KVN9_9EUKA|nr:hypothetical protein TRFO_14129 [Tritrichomonas foetus]|eukprot:OHT15377.1 hypothetical protein TRFO_14129 [Tritrichomonas foetus]